MLLAYRLGSCTYVFFPPVVIPAVSIHLSVVHFLQHDIPSTKKTFLNTHKKAVHVSSLGFELKLSLFRCFEKAGLTCAPLRTVLLTDEPC